jgi:putative membrane protein (TIGR04086 family)
MVILVKKSRKHDRSSAYRILSGIITAYIIITVILLIMAGLTSKGSVPESAMKPAVLVGCFIGGLVGAIVAVRGYSGRRFIFSAGVGGIIILIMFLTGSILAGEQGFAGQFAANAAAVIISTLIVGLTGRRKAFKR